jgi:hypothetical protein
LARVYRGKSLKLGGGGRFQRLVDRLKAQGKSQESAKAIAAAVGRKKYGKRRFAKLAAKGRKRKE